MQCPNCGGQIQAGTDTCPECGHVVAVTVLSRQERDNFNGVTIDEETRDDGRRHSGGTGAGGRTHQINISFASSGWLSKLIIAAVLVLVVFFFLPVLMFFLLVGGGVLIAFWLLRMLIK